MLMEKKISAKLHICLDTNDLCPATNMLSGCKRVERCRSSLLQVMLEYVHDAGAVTADETLNYSNVVCELHLSKHDRGYGRRFIRGAFIRGASFWR